MLSTRPTVRVTLLMRWTPKYPLLASAFGQQDRASASRERRPSVVGAGVAHLASGRRYPGVIVATSALSSATLGTSGVLVRRRPAAGRGSRANAKPCSPSV